jgi:hypothetical protein
MTLSEKDFGTQFFRKVNLDKNIFLRKFEKLVLSENTRDFLSPEFLFLSSIPVHF